MDKFLDKVLVGAVCVMSALGVITLTCIGIMVIHFTGKSVGWWL